MRIAFTGGSGKGGKPVIEYLLAKGHQVVNLDIVPLDNPDVYTYRCDLTDSGEVYNSLSAHFNADEYSLPERPPKADAVIHFATYSRPVPSNTMFRINVTAAYNVIEAAAKLGIKKVIVASSETVYGVCFTQGESDFHSFPIEEDVDCDPEDTYACSKMCNERVARSFARRYGIDIYVLRIGNITQPEDYATKFPKVLADPPSRKRVAWSYVDVRDLGQMCHCAVMKDGLGFQIFNAVNDTITSNVPTTEFLKRQCPNTPITREMREQEAPLSNRKMREVLGFKEEHNWRKYVK